MSKVPKLRFSEFDGEWEEKKFEDLLEFKNGINAKKEQYGKGIKFINVLDILNNNYITYDKVIGKVDIDEKTLSNNEVNYGDIIFQRSSETIEDIGSSNVYLDTKKVTFGGFVIRGKKIGDYDPRFFNFLLKSPRARKQIIVRGVGAQHYNIGQESLSEIKIFFPSIPEQQKIADFLSTIDSQIETKEKQIENLEEMKKGFIQTIFSQELRFKDENREDYSEWEEKKLGDIIKQTNRKNKENLNLPVYAITNTNGFVLQDKFFDKGELASANKSNYKIVQFNEFAYNPARINVGSLALLKTETTGIVSPMYICFKMKKDVKTDFLKLWYETDFFKRQMFRLLEGSVRECLSYDNMCLIKINIPSLPEQQKITNFLSTFDEKIEIEKEILETLKELKKGLLQQMFV